jgi:lysozyme
MRRLPQVGLDLIKSFEGLKLKPYLDSVKVPTIGYGTILYDNGQAVTMNDPEITEERALELLEWEVNQKCAGVEKYIAVPVNDNEYSALVSFAYNLGLGALHGSTLLKLLNAGTDRSAVADQFLKWDKAGGVAVAGLTRRRQAERALFLQPVVQSDEQPSSEDVDSKLQTLEDDIMK